jgi:hypothetical protein
MTSETLFSQTLRDIPISAGPIQAELDRAVWNGKERPSAEAHDLSLGFHGPRNARSERRLMLVAAEHHVSIFLAARGRKPSQLLEKGLPTVSIDPKRSSFGWRP